MTAITSIPHRCLRWQLCTAVFLLLLFHAPFTCALEWHFETVGDALYVGGYTSLALDGSGFVHISYEGYYGLQYTRWDGSSWHTVMVDSEYGNQGSYTSLALDASHYPHISYESNGLRYAYWDGSGWQIETVDIEQGSWASLALDAWGYPHISYGGLELASDLRYAYNDGSGWQIETVDTEDGPFTVGSYTSLALDVVGMAHISYGYSARSGPGELRYAHKDTVGWVIETVIGPAGARFEYTSLALDARGHPHISYYDRGIAPGYDNLNYAYRDASGWRIETVDAAGAVGEYTSLALDGSGWPHISYYADRNGNEALQYACRDASGWHIETVDDVGFVGEYTSLALDGFGWPHISYCGNSDLKYAYATDVGISDMPNVVRPRGIRLLQVCPNPTSTHASILYALDVGDEGASNEVSLKVYDAFGRVVAIPLDHVGSPGNYETRWDLRSVGGRRVPSGIYYLRIGADNAEASDVGKLVVLR
jgi:hypothetical protein